MPTHKRFEIQQLPKNISKPSKPFRAVQSNRSPEEQTLEFSPPTAHETTTTKDAVLKVQQMKTVVNTKCLRT